MRLAKSITLLYKELFIRCVLVLLFLLQAGALGAQILPKEGSVLNYRLIGFSFPQENKAKRYTIEIAAGNHNTRETFRKNIIVTQQSETNKLIAEVPAFGSEYTWQITYSGDRAVTEGKLNHFSTATSRYVDTANCRLRVVKSAEQYKDAHVFSDGLRTLSDMNGKPVWFLPNVDSSMNEFSVIRGLKMSPAGTITFLVEDQNNSKIFEIDYSGNILFKGPNSGTVSGDTTEYYHHDFGRTSKGHYMVLGSERAFIKNPASNDGGRRFTTKENVLMHGKSTTFESTMLGTIIEYDEQGNVVWSWKSSRYFSGKDANAYQTVNPNGSKMAGVEVHENAFFFDEKKNYVYVSFKNIDGILKVKYPEGKVVNEYRGKRKNGLINTPALFCSQHSCKLSENGYIYLYNNNLCNFNALPTIVKLKEPASAKGGLKKIWEYECTVEGAIDNTVVRYEFQSGGNVIELPDRSLFASMAGNYSKIFIVSPDKEILWSAIPEHWNPSGKKWAVFHPYAANIILDQKELETLIWNQRR
jgi:Arylsulfotransferase (ASST)